LNHRNRKRPGYRETKVGWIPEDWIFDSISHVVDIFLGGTPSRRTTEYWDGDIKWATAKDIASTDGKYIFDTTEKITAHGIENSSAKVLEKDTVVITARGTVGKMKLLGEPMSFNQTCYGLRVNGKILPEFLYYSLVQTIKRYKSLFHGAVFDTITTSTFDELFVAFPAIREQKKIIQVIDSWDKAIDLVGKQIEANQRLKIGLMQQLLTGKIRFPGFVDEWKEVKLKSLTKLLVSNVDKKTIEDERSVVLCNYMDVYESEYITSKIDFMPATATDAEIKKFSLRVGDVLLTKDSETREDIASTSVITKIVDSLVCGYHLAILRPDPENVDSIFLAKHLSYGRTHHHFVAYANGATRFGLTISAIENTKICVPKIDEQKRIAEVFLGLDKEIDRLERKIEVFRKQKQGLMQKLLTGEVRVYGGLYDCI